MMHMHKEQNKKGMSWEGNGSILALLSLITLMVMFIEVALVPALPVIANDFGQGQEWISWVLTSYLLTGAISVVLMGRLGDIYGRKRMMTVALIIYIVGLVGCVLSWSISSLIVFRAIQGIGMGMFPLAFGIIAETFPKGAVPVALGLVSAMFAIGSALGMVFGSLIISTLSWKEMIFLAVPLMGALAIFGQRKLKADGERGPGKIDILGAGLFSSSIAAFLIALTEGGAWGWSSLLLEGLMLTSLLLGIAFVLWERKAKDPIVSLQLVFNRNVGAPMINMLIVGMAMFAVYQSLPFFIGAPAEVGGLAVNDTFVIGLFLLPAAIAELIVSPMGGRLNALIGADVSQVLSMAVLAVGLVSLAVWNDGAAPILIGIFVVGAGLGLSMITPMNVVAAAVTKEEYGVANGMITLFKIMGGALGPVLAATIMTSYMIEWTPLSGAPLLTVTGESGYMWTWVIIGAIVGLGALMTLIVRPGKGIVFEGIRKSLHSM
jgi:MFS family permease